MKEYVAGIKDFLEDVEGMTRRQGQRRARTIIQTACWMYGYEPMTEHAAGRIDAALDSVGC
jgi:hypothetical protein